MGTPTPKGSPAWTARLLRSTLQDAVDMLADASEVAVQQPSVAHRASIHAYITQSPHRELLAGVYDFNKEVVERLLRASFDMTKAIIGILESDDPAPVSALILDRALGEVILRVCFIYDAAVPPARTLVRMALYQLESLEGNLRTAEAFGEEGADEAARARETIAEMHAMLTAGGFEIGPGRRPSLSAWLRLDGETESASFNATDAYKRYVKVGSWQWAIGSGATHSLGWLLPNVVGTVDEPPMSTPSETLLTVFLSIIEVADALAQAVHGYTGADIEWFLKKIHQRRLGASAAQGDPMSHAVDHREYGSKLRQPSFPTASGGASFRTI
ncbi:hypothetical protein J7E29_15045 [Streptomyces sp. ISL-90]|nr:hypothetical protein [Streptomyces sp. ISL-90]